MNYHFVIGLHRAGTHTYAEYLAEKLNLPFIEESGIGLFDLERVKYLIDGNTIDHDEGEDEEDVYHIPMFRISIGEDGFERELIRHGEVSKGYESVINKVSVANDSLNNGFILQCPFLSHHALELAEHGNVYWLKRNSLDTVTSMRNGNFEMFSFRHLRDFYFRFPKDPIWLKVEAEYRDPKDVHNGFINHYALLLRAKEYFLNKYFKDKVEVVHMEKQPYYDRNKSLTSKKPLRDSEARYLKL